MRGPVTNSIFSLPGGAAALLGCALLLWGEASASAGAVVYLNKDGGVYTPGMPNDSRKNVSSLVSTTLEVSPWAVSDAGWERVVSCVRGLFGPFDVDVRTEDPGAESHIECLVGGQPSMVGADATVGGSAPVWSDCAVVENSIVFVFPEVFRGPEPRDMQLEERRVCETIAQEVAHSLGLDHQYTCADPMTYLTGCGEKRFLFQDSACGRWEQEPCRCGRQTQNSARLLLERLGPGPRIAMWLSEPRPGQVVKIGSTVTAATNYVPSSIDLYVDGIHYDVDPVADVRPDYQTYQLPTPPGLAPGEHLLEVVARYPGSEITESATITFERSAASAPYVAGGCEAGGEAASPAGLVLLLVHLFGVARRSRVHRRRRARR